MRDIVISGATGFLGRNLARKFLEKGDRVWAVIRPDSRNKGILGGYDSNLKPIFCSLSDSKKIISTIKKADAWFHFAWAGVNREEIDSPKVQKQNVEMSVNVVNMAHALQCKVFMDAGSRVEYGIVDGIMEESIECHPVNEYGKAKLQFYYEASALCRQYGMKYCHLRFFSVYGYGDHPWSIISTLLRELPRGNAVSLSACLHQWNFMYIDDAVDAVYHLYEAVDDREDFKADIFNIASKDTRKLKEFVEEIYRIVGNKGKLEFGTFVQAKEGALSIIPDIQRLYNITGGWKEKYSFEKGIRESLKGYMQNNEEN